MIQREHIGLSATGDRPWDCRSTATTWRPAASHSIDLAERLVRELQ